MWEDLMGERGLKNFIASFVTSVLLMLIMIFFIIGFYEGDLDILGFGAGITLGTFMILHQGQDRKIDNLEKRVKEDENKIEKISRKDKVIDLDKLDEQRKKMQED